MSLPRDEADAMRSSDSDASPVPGPAVNGTSDAAPNAAAGTFARVSESPWFWVALFGMGALAALLASTPKYGMRQGSIETRFQNRERAIQWQGEEVTSSAAVEQTRLPRSPDERILLIPLWPVMLAVAGMVVFAIARLWLRELPSQAVGGTRCSCDKSRAKNG